MFSVYNITINTKEVTPIDRRILIDRLTKEAGLEFHRHGGKHDIYIKDGRREMIPRHRNIDEDLAKAILKRWGLK